MTDMTIKALHTETDYKAALKAIAPLLECDPEPGTAEYDYLDVMITLIEKYEAKHYPISTPPPPVNTTTHAHNQ